MKNHVVVSNPPLLPSAKIKEWRRDPFLWAGGPQTKAGGPNLAGGLFLNGL